MIFNSKLLINLLFPFFVSFHFYKLTTTTTKKTLILYNLKIHLIHIIDESKYMMKIFFSYFNILMFIAICIFRLFVIYIAIYIQLYYHYSSCVLMVRKFDEKIYYINKYKCFELCKA